MKKLNTVVIGLGRAGWQMHIPEILRNPNYNLIAVVDPLQDRLDEAQTNFDVRGYCDCESLFKSEKPDLVVIASPTHFHVEQAEMAFKNGVDVFCDKPMAPSLKDADRMIESMKRWGRKLIIYQPHRTYVDAVALKDIIEKNIIGSIYMIKRAWTRYRIRVDWQAFLKYGGGELSNSGAHFIDQLLYLACSPMKKITSFVRKIASRGDAEDMAKIVMETENGMILDLDINMAAAIPISPWQVLGERGSIIWDEEKKGWWVRYYNKEEFSGIDLQNNLAADNRSYCDDQDIPWKESFFPISDFESIDYYEKCYEYFALDKEPFVPVTDSREVMRIIESCKQVEKKSS